MKNNDAAIRTALALVAPLRRKVDALRAAYPREAREHACGRYSWPTLDALQARLSDAFIVAALRAGADPSTIGPSADVKRIMCGALPLPG